MRIPEMSLLLWGVYLFSLTIKFGRLKRTTQMLPKNSQEKQMG